LVTIDRIRLETPPMAKPNYSFEKRQREMAKKKKKEEKLKEKAGRKVGSGQDAGDEPQEGTAAVTPPVDQPAP
jgi:hypothetical protein